MVKKWLFFWNRITHKLKKEKPKMLKTCFGYDMINISFDNICITYFGDGAARYHVRLARDERRRRGGGQRRGHHAEREATAGTF